MKVNTLVKLQYNGAEAGIQSQTKLGQSSNKEAAVTISSSSLEKSPAPPPQQSNIQPTDPCPLLT